MQNLHFKVSLSDTVVQPNIEIFGFGNKIFLVDVYTQTSSIIKDQFNLQINHPKPKAMAQQQS